MLPLLILLFILVPLAELYVIIKVGQAIGIGTTIAILLADSILGAVLLRAQGRGAWVRFNRALAENRMPAREVFDGVLVIFGGALLLTPGFITDVVGLLLLVPPTRAMVRAAARRMVVGRLAMGPRAAAWGVGRVRERRGRRPRPGAPAPDGGSAGGGRSAAEDFGWTAPGSGRGRPEDIEGTGHEIRDEPPPPGEADEASSR